ncbi:hypothetical protein [Paraburkholderia edwinii]|uniref:hypothetical protein n=1 Tax=Paraburkholderia edwinii TaxID=2861782 RepID=UPI001FEB5F9A|nr:hypothetical protein [Paraburkholderia edwinii]
MTVKFRLYRGLEIYPLVFPRRPTLSGRGHDYEEGFDAAVRIQEPTVESVPTRSRVFRLVTQSAYRNAGDARRACTAYAEEMIDNCPSDEAIFEWNMGESVSIETERNAQGRPAPSKRPIFADFTR